MKVSYHAVISMISTIGTYWNSNDENTLFDNNGNIALMLWKNKNIQAQYLISCFFFSFLLIQILLK